MKHPKLANKQPFFARFLEAQLTEDVNETGGAGSPEASMTGAWKDGITAPTKDGLTAPAKDGHHTMKYPSDGDDTV